MEYLACWVVRGALPTMFASYPVAAKLPDSVERSRILVSMVWVTCVGAFSPHSYRATHNTNDATPE